jgi:hypothetical protein
LCILAAIKSKRSHNLPTTCGELSPKKFEDSHPDPGSGSSSLVVFNCQIPDHRDFDISLVLEYHVQQVESVVLRLSLLLANENPIDTGILRTVLRTLFHQLATLTHRSFPDLLPDILSNRRAFQYSLCVASRGVQTLYKELWAAALRAGVLGRSRGYVASTGRPIEPGNLVKESDERSIVPSHNVGVQQLLWKSRELADELRFWLALLRAGRSL